MTEIAIKEDVIRQAHPARIGASFFTRVAVTAIALIIWFWSQKLIGARSPRLWQSAIDYTLSRLQQTSTCTLILQ